MTDITVVHDEAKRHRREWARRVMDFFGRIGRELRDLLEAADEYEAAEAAVAMLQLSGAAAPEPEDVALLLEDVHEGLVEASFLAVDAAARAGLGPRDLHVALRWYGARLKETSGHTS